MAELEATWARVLRVWWALFWRGVVYIMIPAFFVGAAAGFYYAVRQVPIEPNLWKVQIVAGVLGTLIGIWIVKVILGKSFGGFRIALLPVAGQDADHSDPARVD